jgi:hypothetical protein
MTPKSSAALVKSVQRLGSKTKYVTRASVNATSPAHSMDLSRGNHKNMHDCGGNSRTIQHAARFLRMPAGHRGQGAGRLVDVRADPARANLALKRPPDAWTGPCFKG